MKRRKYRDHICTGADVTAAKSYALGTESELRVKWSECQSKHSKHYLELCEVCEVAVSQLLSLEKPSM